MKTKAIVSLATALLLATLNSQLSTVFAQGSLTPPGPPVPTMKTLDQIEARTPITNTSSRVTISQPGSYYLAHNLTVSTGDGVDINTNQVTLDLNGFTIASTASGGSGSAIYLSLASGNTDITILNGHIKSTVTNNAAGIFSGSGFVQGVYFNEAGTPRTIRVTGISVSGAISNGIVLGTGNSTVVESCTVKSAGWVGIEADTVIQCAAFGCGQFGILGITTSSSNGEEVKSDGYGIEASVASNCAGTSNGTNGTALYANSLNNCAGTSYGNGGTGIQADSANNCSGYSYGAGGTGINATIANACSGSDFGPGTNGVGLDAGSAIGCVGYSGGTGIHANIANSCVVGGGTTNITHKYNMP